MTFTMPHESGISIHLRLDTVVALSYLLKMRGREKSHDMFSGSKGIWDFLSSRKTAITTEHLLRVKNLEADWEPRNRKDTSKWKLCTEVFRMICQGNETPDIELFVSRISQQLPQYISWKLDPFGRGQDAVRINRSWTFTDAFLLFALIRLV